MKKLLLILAACLVSAFALQSATEPIHVGERLELFVDRHLIDEITGDAELKMHRPEPREVVLVTGEPWEGNTCAYYTIFEDSRDGKPLYRMYYRGSHWIVETKKASHPEVVCYAESNDGIKWVKPKLGLFEFNGSKENNIVWNGVGTHNFTVFKDKNPNCQPDARYKAIARGRSLVKGDKASKHGLFVYKSKDGIHWKLYKDEPVITKGAFDSQNLAFWDPVEKQYRDYHRYFNSDRKRDIMTSVSHDFVNWSEPVPINYEDGRSEHLYTNAIQPYDRAPHILIGFPTRYIPKGSAVAPLIMTGRDRLNFYKWPEPVIPMSAPKDRAGNRSNYMTWGMLRLSGAREEISVYATEAYYEGPNSRLRRFVYRNNGFVSLHAGAGKTGELLTKPLTFCSATNPQGLSFLLMVDGDIHDGGSIQVSLVDEAGKEIPGFGAGQSKWNGKGGSIGSSVNWKNADADKWSDLNSLSGRAIRLKIKITNADVYAFRFGRLIIY